MSSIADVKAFLTQLDRIPSEHSSTDATGLVNTVLCSPIANLGLADLQIYDIEGYFDIKSNEKVPAYKFYLKEADHIATLVSP